MPPKKKAKIASVSPSKPASSSRSRRSRTRSASVVSPAPTTKKGRRRLVKAEHNDTLVKDEDKEEDEAGRLSPVWHGDERPQLECYVELPPPPTSVEDRLMFVRPKNKDRLKAKGKQKENSDDAPVWLIDNKPEDCDPFHFSEQDLDESLDSILIAVKPKVAKTISKPDSAQPAPPSKTKTIKERISTPGLERNTSNATATQSNPRAASIQPSHSNDTSAPEKSTSAPAQPAEASRSKVQRAAELLSQIPSSQPAHDGLEDLFLDGSNGGAGSDQEDGAPLFFESSSEEEDRLRNGTPAGTQSQRARVTTSPSYSSKLVQSSSTTDSAAEAERRQRIQSKKARKKQEVEQRMRKEKDRMREKRKERKRLKEIRLEKEKLQSEEKKRRSATIELDSDGGKQSKSDDVSNLRSELNEDAFARSTGARHKEEYRNKLAAFSQARKKARLERGVSVGSDSDSKSDDEDDEERVNAKRTRLVNGKRATTVSSGSSSSGSDSDSDGDSDDSSSSDDSKDFIVGDDEVEYDEGFQPEDDPSSSAAKGKSQSQLPPTSQRPLLATDDRRRFDRDSDGRIHLIPISHASATSTSTTSILAAHGLAGSGSRKGLDELCLDWLEWAVARVLVTWSALSLSDRERLERNRAALKSRMRSTEESVSSVVMRRQFKWYLTEFPKIKVEPVFSDEVEKFGSLAKNGCGICHRKSQKAQFKVSFSGKRYNQVTLAPLKRDVDSDSEETSSESDSSSSDSDSDSGTESDKSSDNETWREVGRDDEKGHATFSFFAGNHCAQRAAVMHALHHWEWSTMQTLAKHDSIRYIRRQLWRKDRMGRGKDGRMGAGAWEVAFVVEEMISPSGRCTWKGKEKEDESKGKRGKSGSVSELDRLKRRLKGLVEQAIEVNRAR
ncbi:uncharacterized protein UTRI_06599 [Ustilago trichophora]|uniref:DUF4211 domain-containing protein n=1 Tax=Ustilago trichophora TaxID=86804 RepID=A0A5C3EQD3_9BASI|nr:uncharacterized protein UTRI_06599 [Ustilago trichophora]